MGIALLLAVGLAWWLHSRGALLPNLLQWGGAATIGLIGLRMLETGKPLLALIAAGAAYAWWRTQAPKPKLPADETAARALLRVPPGASADAIQSAWRSAMQTAHPDAGGSDAAAAAVTAARDLLLKRQPR